jgi:uncharacterized coiled-coil protein SlyX
MESQIMEERADRMARLENPATRQDAVLTEFDADLAAAMDRRDRARARTDMAKAEADAAEEANMSWFQKKAKFAALVRRIWQKIVRLLTSISEKERVGNREIQPSEQV